MQTQNNQNGLTNPNELIKITVSNDGKKMVSARELYEFLEVSTPFTMWCNRMLEYGFEEGFDFNLHKNVKVQIEGGRAINREVVDYILTLDTAKEIAMLQRSFKGKQVRKYFIKAEETLRTVVAEQAVLPPVPEPPKLIERVITLKEFNVLVKTMLINEVKYYKLSDVQRLVGVVNMTTPQNIRNLMLIPNQKHVHKVGLKVSNQAVHVDEFALFVYLQNSMHPLAKQLLNLLNAQKS